MRWLEGKLNLQFFFFLELIGRLFDTIALAGVIG